jgi:hypothetical protein
MMLLVHHVWCLACHVFVLEQRLNFNAEGVHCCVAHYLKFLQCFSIIVAEVGWILVCRILSDKMNLASSSVYQLHSPFFNIHVCCSMMFCPVVISVGAKSSLHGKLFQLCRSKGSLMNGPMLLLVPVQPIAQFYRYYVKFEINLLVNWFLKVLNF